MKSAIFTTLLLGLLVSCMPEKRDMSVIEIQRIIDTSLQAGDSFERIEEFMKNSHMLYDFDYHESRFQARIDDGQVDTDNIAIYIYVDIDGKFVNAHVERVFTHL